MVGTQYRHEDGQALPIVVLFMLVLLAVAALVLDGGLAYAQRRYMQNAADAAVLSASITIANGEYRDAVVRQRALQYAQLNRATSIQLTYLDAGGNPLPDPTDGRVPANATSVRVTAASTTTTNFAHLLGLRTFNISAQAVARTAPGSMPNQMFGLAPLTVPINFYDSCRAANARCDLWDSSYASAWGIPANEYKSLIDLSRGSAGGSMPQNISAWTYAGYPGVINTNTWFPIVTGNYGNNVANSLRQRIIDAPGGVDPDGVIWGYIDIGIWNQYNATDRSVRIIKFGRFKVRLTDVYGSKTFGHFIDFVVPGHERGTDDGPGAPTLIILGG